MALPLFHAQNQLLLHQPIDLARAKHNNKVPFPIYFVRLAGQSCHQKILTFVE